MLVEASVFQPPSLLVDKIAHAGLGSQGFAVGHALVLTLPPSIRQPDQKRKALVLVLAEQGMSYRRIARELSVHNQTVIGGISSHSAQGAE